MPGGTRWDDDFAASTLSLVLRGQSEGISIAGIAISLFYLLGISAAVYHFANGLWTSAITWGLTVSQAAQRRWGVICTGVGAVLMLMAWSALIGFLTVDPDAARGIEAQGEARHADASMLSGSEGP